MAFILPAEEYDAIRDRLGVEDIELTDATIERTPFLPRAERDVRQHVAEWSTIMDLPDGDDQRVTLLSAIIVRAAYYLVPRFHNASRTRERIGDFTSGDIDWEAFRAQLVDEYRELLEDLMNVRPARPGVAFTMAGISRAEGRRKLSDRPPWEW